VADGLFLRGPPHSPPTPTSTPASDPQPPTPDCPAFLPLPETPINAKGNVAAISLYPNVATWGVHATGNYDELFRNALATVGTPIPEPSTYLAGALLLAPFGASAIRSLRNRKQVTCVLPLLGS